MIFEKLLNLLLCDFGVPRISGLETDDRRLFAMIGTAHFDELHFIFQTICLDRLFAERSDFGMFAALFSVTNKNCLLREARFAHRYFIFKICKKTNVRPLSSALVIFVV